MTRIHRLSSPHIVFAFLLFAAFGFAQRSEAQTATTTALQVSSACQDQGCVTTLTATVTAGSTAVHPGLVVFCDKGPTDCSNTAPIGRAQLLANGTATIKLQTTPGSHTLHAIFHGTRAYTGSISVAQDLEIGSSAATDRSTSLQLSPYSANGGVAFNGALISYGPVRPTGRVPIIDTSRNNAVIAHPILTPYETGVSYSQANSDFTKIPQSILDGTVQTVAGDFNNDGFQDIAETDANGVLNVLLGNGAAGFTLASSTGLITGAHGALLVADFNGDGRPDIAISDAATKRIQIALGNGDGTFTAASPTTLTDTPQHLAVGDFNDDGVADIVSLSSITLSGQTTIIEILLGQGDGSFKEQTPISVNGNSLNSLGVADFNRDGFPDVAVFDSTTSKAVIFKGNGDGSFAATPFITSTLLPGVIATGDFDGDGIPDLVSNGNGPAYYNGTVTPNAIFVTLVHGNGDFTFAYTPPTIYSNFYGYGTPTPLTIADFGSSGSLGAGSYSNGGVNVTYFGKTSALTPFVQGAPLPGVPFADFTGDGVPDSVYFPSGPYTNLSGPEVDAAIFQNYDTLPSYNVVPLDPGPHNLVSSYPGDAFHDASMSTPVQVQGSTLDYGYGFSGETGLTINGAAKVNGTAIQLTDGRPFEAGSFFSSKRLPIGFAGHTGYNSGSFQSDFDFNLGDGSGDGFAFVLQSNGPNAIGSSAGGLGYGNAPGAVGGGITNSYAIAFDLHNNQGEGSNSVRLETNGVTTGTGAVDLTPNGLDLHSGHTFHATISNYGSIQVTLTDLTTRKSYSFYLYDNNAPLDPLNGFTGYVGFTGATGGNGSVLTVNNWLLTVNLPPNSTNPKPSYADGFADSTGLGFNGVAAVSGSALQLTNNTQYKATTAYYVYKVFPQNTFTTDFDFQITNGVGDGFTFVIQGNRLASIGEQGGGLGYGPMLPTDPVIATDSIPNSLAIKFDTHNNAGEGDNSTGIYTNGASPTTPSIPLTSSGINLQNGHIFHGHLNYDTTGLTLSITDLTKYEVFTKLFPASLYPQSSLPIQAFVGFTAGTGETPSSIQILNWDWTAF